MKPHTENDPGCSESEKCATLKDAAQALSKTSKCVESSVIIVDEGVYPADGLVLKDITFAALTVRGSTPRAKIESRTQGVAVGLQILGAGSVTVESITTAFSTFISAAQHGNASKPSISLLSSSFPAGLEVHVAAALNVRDSMVGGIDSGSFTVLSAAVISIDKNSSISAGADLTADTLSILDSKWFNPQPHNGGATPLTARVNEFTVRGSLFKDTEVSLQSNPLAGKTSDTLHMSFTGNTVFDNTTLEATGGWLLWVSLDDTVVTNTDLTLRSDLPGANRNAPIVLHPSITAPGGTIVQVSISNCLFSNNAGNQAGAIVLPDASAFVTSTSLTIVNTTFRANRAHFQEVYDGNWNGAAPAIYPGNHVGGTIDFDHFSMHGVIFDSNQPAHLAPVGGNATRTLLGPSYGPKPGSMTDLRCRNAPSATFKPNCVATTCPGDSTIGGTSLDGIFSCGSCAAGSGPSGGDCEPCPAGMYSDLGLCKLCDYQFFANSTGQKSCTLCSGLSREYTPGKGATHCSLCPMDRVINTPTGDDGPWTCDKCGWILNSNSDGIVCVPGWHLWMVVAFGIAALSAVAYLGIRRFCPGDSGSTMPSSLAYDARSSPATDDMGHVDPTKVATKEEGYPEAATQRLLGQAV